jgi:GNAT superfamily N-acetyltransferase
VGAPAEIEYTTEHARVSLDPLVELLDSVGWSHRTADRERFAQAVRGSPWIVAAFHSGALVGFCRAFTDGALGAYVNDVVVRPSHQGRGIGRELLRRLMEGRERVSFVWHADPPVHAFYKKLGFEPVPDMFRRPRRELTPGMVPTTKEP